MGYSFGSTAFNEENQKSIGTIRVETKQCYVAYIAPGALYHLMAKQKIRKEEKMLNIVR